LQHGADVNSSDGFGHNPSFWAFSKRHFDMIKQLHLPNPRSSSFRDHLRSIGATLDTYNTAGKTGKKGGNSKIKKKK
jgi:ankyrin repeat protein